MVVKCPYCGSVDVSKELVEESMFSADAERTFEAKCRKCREDFIIEISYELTTKAIAYSDDCGSFIKEEAGE